MTIPLTQRFTFLLLIAAPRGPATPVLYSYLGHNMGFPGGSVVKNTPANAGDVGLIPGSGRSPVGGNGNPHQYSHMKNPTDREAGWATVHGMAKESDTT